MDALRVAALPTLSPWTLLQPPKAENVHLPFSSANSRYFYFARNAVWLIVQQMGLAGSEVLVPAYHHGVEIEALVDAGAIPKFYRVDDRWNVDLADVERRIGPRTRALYLIHYAGFPGPAEEMKRLADKRGLLFIEDCALSLLSSKEGVPLGSWGDAAIFCLYKTLPVPNGGALVTRGAASVEVSPLKAPALASVASHALSSLLLHLELHGGAAGRWARGAVRQLGHRAIAASSVQRVATGTQHFNRAHVDWGMSPLSSRIASSLDLSEIVHERRRNYLYLTARLADAAPPLVAALPSGVCPLFYPLAVADKEKFRARLLSRGIETVDFWRDFHPACDPGEFPEAASLRRRIVEIPCHQGLSAEALTLLVEAVRDAVSLEARAA